MNRIARFALPTLLAACADDGIARTVLTEVEATENAEDLLTALDDGDYELYVQDFSEPMKEVVTEEYFLTLRDDLRALSGDFVSIDAVEVEDADAADHVQWVFDTTFTKEPVWVEMVYAEDDVLVEGLHFYSENIDAAR